MLNKAVKLNIILWWAQVLLYGTVVHHWSWCTCKVDKKRYPYLYFYFMYVLRVFLTSWCMIGGMCVSLCVWVCFAWEVGYVLCYVSCMSFFLPIDLVAKTKSLHKPCFVLTLWYWWDIDCRNTILGLRHRINNVHKIYTNFNNHYTCTCKYITTAKQTILATVVL